MRPNVATTRDPLNLAALPPTQGMELDYRTGGTTGLLPALIGITCTAFLATVLVRVLDLSFSSPLGAAAAIVALYFILGAYVQPVIVSGLVNAVRFFCHAGIVLLGIVVVVFCLSGHPFPLLIFGAAVALIAIVDGLFVIFAGNLLPGLVIASYGVGVAALSLFVRFSAASPTSSLLFLTLAIALVAWLADAIATHYAMWANANHRLSRETRRHWQAAWTARFNLPAAADFRRYLACQGSPHIDLSVYPLGFIFLATALLLGFAAGVPAAATPFFGFALVTTAFVSLIVLAIAWTEHGLSADDRKTSRRVFLTAVGSWFSYNTHETHAPGVFRSPYGPKSARVLLTTATLFLLSTGMLTSAKYFPVGLLFCGPAPFVEPDLQRTFASLKGGTVEIAAPVSSLSPSEARYCERLPASARERFLKDLGVRRATEGGLADVRDEVQSTPEGWVKLSALSIFGPSKFAVLALFPSLIASILAPVLFLLAAAYLIAGRAMLVYYKALEADEATDADQALTRWDAYTRRLRESSDQANERDHLWLGTSVENDYPILIHRDILREHAHILGDSGSGKTSLALAPLITQLLRMPDRELADGQRQLQPSILVLDLKGDETLFHAARIEAEQAGVPFKFFTNDRQCATHIFNPFLQSHLLRLPTDQRVQIFLQALGLEYGEFYGGGYFSSINENVFRKLLAAFPQTQSFGQLADRSSNRAYLEQAGATRDEAKDAAHLFAVMQRLKGLLALNLAPSDNPPPPAQAIQAAIDLDDLLDPENRQVVYFFLKPSIEAVTTRTVAKLALYSLLAAAAQHHPKNRRPALVVIDEFQQIVAQNLTTILQQARSMDLGLVLANQNITDLKTKDVDFVPVVEANTRLKQFFSAASLSQLRQLVEASGEAMYELASQTISVQSKKHWTQTGQSFVATTDDGLQSISAQEQIGPRFRPNDIMAMSDDPLCCVIHVSRGLGYTQFAGLPIMAYADYHISATEYKRRRTEENWPAPTAATIVEADLRPVQATAPPVAPPVLKPPPAPVSPEAQAAFDAELSRFATASPPAKKRRRKGQQPQAGEAPKEE